MRLEACGAEQTPLVGGKAAGLAALMRAGFQVPPGFAITTGAYLEHLEHNHLRTPIEGLLAHCASLEAQQRAADDIRGLFEASRLTPALEDEVLAAYERLCQVARVPTGADQTAPRPAACPVAVRSSATAEDRADASFAGQQETYLWIIGGQEVLRHIVRCWASLFTPQALAYRAQRLQATPTDLAMGVVVQQMVPAQTAGVMLTIDPTTGDRSSILIEAAPGLGAAVVNGEVTPDRVYVDKVLLEIRSRSIGVKHVAYRFDPSLQGIRLEVVPAEQQVQACLTDAESIRLARLGKHLEQAMGRPQDVEWAIGPGPAGPREIYLLQARPETVWSQKPPPAPAEAGSTVMERILRTLGHAQAQSSSTSASTGASP
ncbi:MAG TPA: PEP/pyruvate-binding domain-containing protein, partial [Longimicrobiales bacterium]